MEDIIEFDKLKTKVLKYITYKKRTEREVRNKFMDADQNMLEEVVENLKELEYIGDDKYIEKAVNEFMRLKNMSIKEMKYKLMTKGLHKTRIEEYIDKNWDMMYEYEQTSAEKIAIKKERIMTAEEIRKFLMTKGYTVDIIENAIKGMTEN